MFSKGFTNKGFRYLDKYGAIDLETFPSFSEKYHFLAKLSGRGNKNTSNATE